MPGFVFIHLPTLYLLTLLKKINIGNQSIGLFIPDNPETIAGIHSPYWGKVWPAAIGLCNFLQSSLHYINRKKVLELAAGLGLPGLFAASYANSLCLSDIEPTAVAYMEESVKLNNLTNVQCRVIDWNKAGEMEIPDTLLLSDVNYEPAVFDSLYQSLMYFLNKGCIIILSTPQRLMAKEFINRLLPHVIQQDEVTVETEPATAISIFVLKQ